MVLERHDGDTRRLGIEASDAFSLSTATKPASLLLRGRRVGAIQATQVDMQFRLADGSFLVLASDTTPFAEHLAVVHAAPDGRVREAALVGGAYTPGRLSYAYPSGPCSVVFCFHDLEHEVTVREQVGWLGRRRWLRLREPEHVNQP